ncbi:hypothetical protein KEM54_003025 [Ascosphaera aggregata]|nr:hypothetical protein KEM54_003025 [Ascosphaera aggregata]
MPGHASMPSMSMPGHVGLGVNTPASTNVSGSATSVAAVTPTGTGGFGSFGSGVFGHGSQLVPPNTYGLPAGAGGTITNHGSHGPYSGIGSVGMGMGGMVGMGMGTGIGGMPAPHYSHTGAASNLVMPYAVGSEATASAGTPGNAQQAPAGPSAASTSGNTTSAGDGGGAAPTDNGANNSSASASTTPTGAARGHSTTPGHAHSHSHHGFGNPAAQAAFSSAPSDHSAVANNAGLYGQVGVSGVGVGGSEADPFGFLTREFAGLSVEPAGAASAPGRSQHGGGKSPLKACTN